MIMIKVTKDGITVEGHAGFGPPGSDIVCAAVSALLQTTAKSINDLTADRAECLFESGKGTVKYRNLSEQGQLLVDSFFIGSCAIAEAYKDYVRIA